MSNPGQDTTANVPVASERKVNRSRLWLFGLLIVATSIPQFFPIAMPNKPVPASMAMYSALMSVPDGSSVLVQSDWTTSTRGESGGELKAILRILMRKNCKFVLYSAADPQAPEVAKNVIEQELNPERQKAGESPYKRWNDYVLVGYFPSAEAANNAMAADLRKAWSARKDVTPAGQSDSIWNSPVLKNIHLIGDFPLLVIVTASNTFNIFIERIYGKGPIAAAVTGVMGPESQVYFASNQLVGLTTGLKGVYDLETMMEYGINTPDAQGKVQVEWTGHPAVPRSGKPGDITFETGQLYYPILHVALTLLILAVVTGNVLMIRSRKRRVDDGS